VALVGEESVSGGTRSSQLRDKSGEPPMRIYIIGNSKPEPTPFPTVLKPVYA